MTKSETLQSFFESFNLPAYPENNVPYETTFPWLTYDLPISAFDDDIANMGSVNLYFHTESEAIPNAKAEEISKRIGFGGIVLDCDDGKIWIKRGNPFCLKIQDQNDNAIKRRQLNLEIEYLTF